MPNSWPAANGNRSEIDNPTRSFIPRSPQAGFIVAPAQAGPRASPWLEQGAAREHAAPGFSPSRDRRVGVIPLRLRGSPHPRPPRRPPPPPPAPPPPPPSPSPPPPPP